MLCLAWFARIFTKAMVSAKYVLVRKTQQAHSIVIVVHNTI
jgi:hypothetical protein